MINVFIKSDSHHQVDRNRIRSLVKKTLLHHKIKSRVEVSINIVGDRMMKRLNKKYRDLDETAVVLSFPQLTNGKSKKFILPPDDVLRLGDIVISYPQTVELACVEEKLVDDKIDELVIHGLKHLLGNNSE